MLILFIHSFYKFPVAVKLLREWKEPDWMNYKSMQQVLNHSGPQKAEITKKWKKPAFYCHICSQCELSTNDISGVAKIWSNSSKILKYFRKKEIRYFNSNTDFIFIFLRMYRYIDTQHTHTHILNYRHYKNILNLIYCVSISLTN